MARYVIRFGRSPSPNYSAAVHLAESIDGYRLERQDGGGCAIEALNVRRNVINEATFAVLPIRTDLSGQRDRACGGTCMSP